MSKSVGEGSSSELLFLISRPAPSPSALPLSGEDISRVGRAVGLEQREGGFHFFSSPSPSPLTQMLYLLGEQATRNRGSRT